MLSTSFGPSLPLSGARGSARSPRKSPLLSSSQRVQPLVLRHLSRWGSYCRSSRPSSTSPAGIRGGTGHIRGVDLRTVGLASAFARTGNRLRDPCARVAFPVGTRRSFARPRANEHQGPDSRRRRAEPRTRSRRGAHCNRPRSSRLHAPGSNPERHDPRRDPRCFRSARVAASTAYELEVAGLFLA